MLVERPLPRDGIDRRARAQGQRPVRSVTVNLAESPLSWLHARGHLTDRQFDAGEMLRADWERAQLAPAITMRWDGAPRDKGARGPVRGLTPGEAQIAARARFDAASAALGASLQDIAWRVICAGEGVPVAEQSLGWPARSGKLVLRIALDRLADFYRLPG
jgi:hypothetical protein